MFLVAIPWIASALTTSAAAAATTAATATTITVAEAFMAGTVIGTAAVKGIDLCKEKKKRQKHTQ